MTIKSTVQNWKKFQPKYVYIFLVHHSYVYWGEYPLSFAACLGQEECYRLMLARGANPDNQDTNGNTVLHMLVIYEKLVSSETYSWENQFQIQCSVCVKLTQPEGLYKSRVAFISYCIYLIWHSSVDSFWHGPSLSFIFLCISGYIPPS